MFLWDNARRRSRPRRTYRPVTWTQVPPRDRAGDAVQAVYYVLVGIFVVALTVGLMGCAAACVSGLA
jgi:hypothetical protein